MSAGTSTNVMPGTSRAWPSLYWRYLLEPWLYLSPAILLIGGVMLFPLAIGIAYSFQAIQILRPFNTGWIGFENYADLWSDRKFWIAMSNTLFWTFWSVFFQFFLGLGLALLLNTQFVGKRLFQALVFLPWAVPTFLSALTWSWLFNPVIGPLPHWLAAVGILSEPFNILGDPEIALWGPIAANVWFGVPFFAITLLAALQSIPSELYEAAEIDGATAWQSFAKITLPFLAPMIVITVMLRTIWIGELCRPDLCDDGWGTGQFHPDPVLLHLHHRIPKAGLRVRFCDRCRAARDPSVLCGHTAVAAQEAGEDLSQAMSAIAHRNPLMTAGKYLALACYLGFALFPLYWLLKISVTPDQLIFSEGTALWPSALTFENFSTVIFQSDFLAYFRNSLIVSLSAAAITTMIAAGGGLCILAICLSRQRRCGCVDARDPDVPTSDDHCSDLFHRVQAGVIELPDLADRGLHCIQHPLCNVPDAVVL